jgi:hypothetical protein
MEQPPFVSPGLRTHGQAGTRTSSIRLAGVVAALAAGALARGPAAAAPPPVYDRSPVAESEAAQPFAPVPFRLETEPFSPQKVPPLLGKAESQQLALGISFRYLIVQHQPASGDTSYGARIDMPIGPVRVDYGIPHYQSFGDGRFHFHGDFPGPGYREQRAAPLKQAFPAKGRMPMVRRGALGKSTCLFRAIPHGSASQPLTFLTHMAQAMA